MVTTISLSKHLHSRLGAHPDAFDWICSNLPRQVDEALKEPEDDTADAQAVDRPPEL